MIPAITDITNDVAELSPTNALALLVQVQSGTPSLDTIEFLATDGRHYRCDAEVLRDKYAVYRQVGGSNLLGPADIEDSQLRDAYILQTIKQVSGDHADCNRVFRNALAPFLKDEREEQAFNAQPAFPFGGNDFANSTGATGPALVTA